MTLTATDNAGFSGSESFTWTITNVVTVTSPGDQSNVSGTAISPLAISATDSSSTATLTYSRRRHPAAGPRPSIPPAASISGTPTTAGTYPVTITATDGAGYTGSATFNWTITNTVTVTSPGDQTDVSGTAISPVAISATDSSSAATLTYSDGGTLPPGLVHRPARGVDHRHPDHRGRLPGDHHGHRRLRLPGSASFNWTITNTVTVTSPGDQSDVSGTAISPLAIAASRLVVDGHPDLLGRRHPAARAAIDPSSGVISGTPTTAGSYAVTITATDNAGASGSATFNWTITNTVTVTSPGDQSNVSGTAITPVADRGHAIRRRRPPSPTRTAAPCRPGSSIDPSSGVITGTPTTAGIYAVTITATDGSGASGSATFNWTITNTVTVTSPGDQLDTSGTAITPLAISATDSSSTATLTYSAGGTLPPGSPSTRLRGRQRHPDDRGDLRGHHHGHRRRRGLRIGQLHLDHPQHGHREPGAQPDQ